VPAISQPSLLVTMCSQAPTRASTDAMTALGAQQANLPTGRLDPLPGIDPRRWVINAGALSGSQETSQPPGVYPLRRWLSRFFPIPAPALCCTDRIDGIIAILGDTSSARLSCDRMFSGVGHSSTASLADPPSPSNGKYSPQAS
jgi:hypothetical protein